VDRQLALRSEVLLGIQEMRTSANPVVPFASRLRLWSRWRLGRKCFSGVHGTCSRA